MNSPRGQRRPGRENTQPFPRYYGKNVRSKKHQSCAIFVALFSAPVIGSSKKQPLFRSQSAQSLRESPSPLIFLRKTHLLQLLFIWQKIRSNSSEISEIKLTKTSGKPCGGLLISMMVKRRPIHPFPYSAFGGIHICRPH